MDTYFGGVGIALLIGAVKVVWAFSRLASTRAKNLKKIGLHYKPVDGVFKTERTGVGGLIWFAVWMLILAPLFSWLSVASAAWTLVSAVAKRQPTPEKVRELQRLVASKELTTEQLIELQEELGRIYGKPGPVRTGADEDDDPSALVLESGAGWFHEVRAHPGGKTLTYYGHTPDYDAVFHSVEEYRFDGEQVLVRLLEDCVDNYSKKRWSVKDGVVLESELRKNAEGSAVLSSSLEEDLHTYKSRVQWHPVRNFKLRVFVMAQHPSEFPYKERRRIVRTELERLEAAASKVVADAKAHGLNAVDDEKGTQLVFPTAFTKSDKDKFMEVFSDRYFNAAGMTMHELSVLKELRADLLRQLGESVS